MKKPSKSKKTYQAEKIIILIFCLFVSIFSGCKPAAQEKISKSEMKAFVDKQNEMLGDCFKEGDADKLALMYTDSAKLSPNGYRFVLGRDSIKAFWAEDFKTSKVVDMRTDVMTIDGNRQVIYETGKAFSTIIINDTITYHAKVKYINVWRLQPDGKYLLDIDFWNKDEN